MSKFSPLLPLLIPSFSSKGNLLLPRKDGGYVSDNYELFLALDVRVSKTYLISAYDVFYSLMPQDPSEWPQTEYLFIDSGGYETNDAYDLSERNKFNYYVMPWDIKRMEMVYRSITSSAKYNNSSIVLSGFDNLGPFVEQLTSALRLSRKFPDAIINFIIKLTFPIETLLKSLVQYQSDLSEFMIIGFTEKELGETLKERLSNLISIRKCLLKCGWSGYIHIFGGLEPNLIKLFYYAGADIFDGLSWQRLRFKNNTTLFEPDEFIISRSEYENKFCMMKDNLAFLQNLSNDLSLEIGNRLETMEKLSMEIVKSEEVTILDLLELLEV